MPADTLTPDAVLVRRAWRVTAAGITGIAAATTRGRAVSLVVSQANEAGWNVRWPDVRAVRAGEYDMWAAGVGRDAAWDEQFVKSWRPTS